MIQEYLEHYKRSTYFHENALPLLEELHKKYGQECLDYYLQSDDVQHNVDLMNLIKKQIENDFIISVCATNDIIQDKIKLYELFPNLNLLYSDSMYPEEIIIEKLVDNSRLWFLTFKEWRWPHSNYRVLTKQMFFKGPNWHECPSPIRDHFEKLKG